MIDKQTQDQAWAALTREARADLRKRYKRYKLYGRSILVYIFGKHNLTSDTEPEEMLMVSKSKVMERIKYLYSHPAHIAAHKADERASELRSLFGDKHLSATPIPPNSGELKSQNIDNMEEKEHRNLSQEAANCDKKGAKKLRLDELLIDHIGDTFYCTIFGDVKLSSVDDFVVGIMPPDGVEVSITPSGKLVSTQYLCEVVPILFPSREAYLKYPLDARKAWMEWQEEQIPKRWRAEKGGEYFFVDTDCIAWMTEDDYEFPHEKRYKCGNYFESEGEAQQAAEAVRKCLENFFINRISNENKRR